MTKKIIAWDLGTGGSKASLYSEEGECLAKTFVSYNTYDPFHGWHEQKPEDWWFAIVKSTKQLLAESGVDKNDIVSCGISGHSLGTVCIGRDGYLLNEVTPIWSDGRASKEADKYFSEYDKDEWYMKTGNGFTPAFYTVFKLLWYKENKPDLFSNIYKVIGTKDYINFKLTGKLCTDPSYASGSGVWDLNQWKYSSDLIESMGLNASIFPEIIPSTGIVGKIKKEIADELGLSHNVLVVCGGVDNSCMALGAMAFKEGRIYNSLGSSSWIAVSSKKPILGTKSYPYVFAHVVPGYYASALCLTAGGTSFRWLRDQLCKEIIYEANEINKDPYDLMTYLASKSPVGSNGLLFNPSLGGGMPMDKSYNLRGAYMGLDLVHTNSDIIRATMEGIALGLRTCIEELKSITSIKKDILLVGGGSKSPVWRQIYADVYDMTVLKSNIDEQAAALGAAACAAVGTGIWKNFDIIDKLHVIEEQREPIKENVDYYNTSLILYKKASDYLSEIGDLMKQYGMLN